MLRVESPELRVGAGNIDCVKSWEGNLDPASSASWRLRKSAFIGSLSAFLFAAIGVCLPVSAQTASFDVR